MKTRRMTGSACLLLSAMMVAPGAGAKESEGFLEAEPEMMQNWLDMKFGMFVCWGPVSLTGKEIGWSRGGERRGRAGAGPTPVEVYDTLYMKWKPDRFDASEWVQVAQDAGMNYMIFLVKHHDGFCLYDTKLTDYKSTGPAAAWRHDVMADIADACHDAGLKLFIYYSQPDWHHPDYRTENHRRYIEYLHGQIRELVTNYGRIDGLWFDGLGGSSEDWDAENLFKMAREIQPWLIINNRCGIPGDFDTPEQHIGAFRVDRPWETCMTLGTQWSWKPNDEIKSLKACIHALVSCAGRGGNLALNTNPMPDGRIEPRQAARFREIGQWMRRYGDSLYRTRGGPCKPSFWGVTTHKDNTIYVHVLKWTGDTVTLPPIDKNVVASYVMTGGTAAVKQAEQGITISVPLQHRQELDTIVVLELDGPAAEIEPSGLRSDSIAFGKTATASEFYQNSQTYSPARAFDDDPSTRWGCNYGAHAAWLQVDLGEPYTFRTAWISEPYGRVRKFELQARQGDEWQTFHHGTTIGDNLMVEFAPVTTRHVRLNLLETTEGPSIWEFQLFAVPSNK